LHCIAFADGAFGAGGVHQIQILTSHKHVLNAVTEHPADAAVGRIGLIVGGHGGRFLIFERHLALHFGGDLALDVGCQRHRTCARSGLRLHSGIGRISRGQLLGNDVIGQPERSAGIHGIRSEVEPYAPYHGAAAKPQPKLIGATQGL